MRTVSVVTSRQTMHGFPCTFMWLEGEPMKGAAFRLKRKEGFGVRIKLFLNTSVLHVLHPQAKRARGCRIGKPICFDRKFIFHSWSGVFF